MNEVEKLYELAGIKKQYCGWLDMGDLDTQYTYVRCDSLEEFNDTAMMSRTSFSSEEEDWDKPSIEYPPFTAEKQIELIKWLAVKGDFDSSVDIAKNTYNYWTMYFQGTRWTAEGFEETLAELINNLWQDLTEEECKQIKNILKSEGRE